MNNNIKHIHFDLMNTLFRKNSAVAKKEDGNVVYVGRHGATALNRESGHSADRIRGHIDVPLSDVGIAEAHAVGKKLKGQGIKAIFASDLQRAKQTASIIGDKIGVAEQDLFYNLRPWNLGPTIQGKNSEEVLPKIIYFIEHPNDRPPDGDTFNEFKGNFFNTFFSIIQANIDKDILIITHYRCFKLLEAHKGDGHIDVDQFKKFSGDSTGSIRIFKDGKLIK